jgi:hypothetical protein
MPARSRISPSITNSGMAISMYSLDEFHRISPMARCSGIEE